ncbi:MAG: hypothetical protein ACUVX1_17415 [Chloroflexota bacterium]
MRIVIDIPEAVAYALSRYVATRTYPALDPKTGKPVVLPVYPNRAAVLREHLVGFLKGLVRQFPPPAIEQRLAQIQAAEDHIEQACQVSAEEQ